MTAYQSISAAEAEQLIGQSNPTILDCRKVNDYREGHIENAMLVHEQLRDSMLRKGDKDKALLIYCYHGHTSEHLATMFCDFGFKQVYNLVGGYASWQQHLKTDINLNRSS